MSDSAQEAVVRRLYDARGDPDIIRQVLAPDIRWEVVEGFPYSGIYVGLDDVLRNFFGRLFQDFESFVAVGTEFFESGDRVIALGSYTGRAKATRKEFTARFAHVWTLQGGKIVRLRSYRLHQPKELRSMNKVTFQRKPSGGRRFDWNGRIFRSPHGHDPANRPMSESALSARTSNVSERNACTARQPAVTTR
jgi:uncharacterized protein